MTRQRRTTREKKGSITPTPRLVALLIAVGAALLLLSHLLQPRQTPINPGSIGSPRPSPTWRSLPTRVLPTPTASPPIDLQPLHQALLRQDAEEAERLWQSAIHTIAAMPTDTVNAPTAEQISERQQAGARLALLQGQPQLAATRAWKAVGATPQDPHAWSLLGLILRQNQEHALADQALAIAGALDPTIAPVLFRDRWQIAILSGDAMQLTQLAVDYQTQHPDSAWSPYYQAEALIAGDAPQEAIAVLVAALSEAPASPALLWYTLGRAYLARGAYAEAATVFEVAASLTFKGDSSLDSTTADAIYALNLALAQSYLGNRQCQEAESITRRLLKASEQTDRHHRAEGEDAAGQNASAPAADSDAPVHPTPDLALMLETAIICQTPTPTLTPWIPSQIGP